MTNKKVELLEDAIHDLKRSTVELLEDTIHDLKRSRTEAENDIVKLESKMRQIDRIFIIFMAFGLGTLFGLLLAPLF